MNPSDNFSFRFILPQVFGDTVQIKVMEILLRNLIEEQKQAHPIWLNFSDIAEIGHIAKSSSKRILEQLLKQGYIEEKQIETHAQNPPRMIHLVSNHPVMVELLFFFKKARGLL